MPWPDIPDMVLRWYFNTACRHETRQVVAFSTCDLCIELGSPCDGLCMRPHPDLGLSAARDARTCGGGWLKRGLSLECTYYLEATVCSRIEWPRAASEKAVFRKERLSLTQASVEQYIKHTDPLYLIRTSISASNASSARIVFRDAGRKPSAASQAHPSLRWGTARPRSSTRSTSQSART